MNLLILKSDIATPEAVRHVGEVFKTHPGINKWTVDLDDVVCVLRIEFIHQLNEQHVQEMIGSLGYHCQSQS